MCSCVYRVVMVKLSLSSLFIGLCTQILWGCFPVSCTIRLERVNHGVPGIKTCLSNQKKTLHFHRSGLNARDAVTYIPITVTISVIFEWPIDITNETLEYYDILSYYNYIIVLLPWCAGAHANNAFDIWVRCSALNSDFYSYLSYFVVFCRICTKSSKTGLQSYKYHNNALTFR